VLGPERKPYGPFTFEKLQAYVSDGRLLATTLVCRRGSSRWMKAREVDGLFPARAVIVRAPSVVAHEQAVERRSSTTGGPSPRGHERLRSIVLMLVVGLIAWGLTITPSGLRYARAIRESDAAREEADRQMAPVREGFDEIRKQYSEVERKVAEAASRGQRSYYFDPDSGAVLDPMKEANRQLGNANTMMSTAEGLADFHVAAALVRERQALDELLGAAILGLGIGLAAAVVSLIARVLLLRL
jgi:hypothetical protein